MRALSLFSGIGGFDLAAEWTGFEVAGFVELDPFCQKVLRKHWPHVKLIEDIHNVKGDEFGPIDIIYGGFPCQPFSVAGLQRGEEDDRYLWPQTMAVIAAIRPRWCLLENVTGIIKLALDTVLADLEAEGYTCGVCVLPACAKNAPHRRDRVWICAHSVNSTDRTIGRQVSEEDGIQGINREKVGSGMSSGTDSHAPDTTINGLHNIRTEGRVQERPFNSIDSRSIGWNEPWLEAATRLCRVDARVSGRVDRLKSLGNAIVPQIAYEIMKAIKEIEEGEK